MCETMDRWRWYWGLVREAGGGGGGEDKQSREERRELGARKWWVESRVRSWRKEVKVSGGLKGASSRSSWAWPMGRPRDLRREMALRWERRVEPTVSPCMHSCVNTCCIFDLFSRSYQSMTIFSLPPSILFSLYSLEFPSAFSNDISSCPCNFLTNFPSGTSFNPLSVFLTLRKPQLSYKASINPTNFSSSPAITRSSSTLPPTTPTAANNCTKCQYFHIFFQFIFLLFYSLILNHCAQADCDCDPRICVQIRQHQGMERRCGVMCKSLVNLHSWAKMALGSVSGCRLQGSKYSWNRRNRVGDRDRSTMQQFSGKQSLCTMPTRRPNSVFSITNSYRALRFSSTTLSPAPQPAPWPSTSAPSAPSIPTQALNPTPPSLPFTLPYSISRSLLIFSTFISIFYQAACSFQGRS